MRGRPEVTGHFSQIRATYRELGPQTLETPLSCLSNYGIPFPSFPSPHHSGAAVPNSGCSQYTPPQPSPGSLETMQQLPGPSQTHLAWKSAFQAKIPFYFYAICISLAFWKNFKKQDMSPAVVGTPPGLGIFRTKVPDGQGHAWRMSFVEMIDAVSSRAEYCSHLFTWINSINIYMP